MDISLWLLLKGTQGQSEIGFAGHPEIIFCSISLHQIITDYIMTIEFSIMNAKCAFISTIE